MFRFSRQNKRNRFTIVLLHGGSISFYFCPKRWIFLRKIRSRRFGREAEHTHFYMVVLFLFISARKDECFYAGFVPAGSVREAEHTHFYAGFVPARPVGGRNNIFYPSTTPPSVSVSAREILDIEISYATRFSVVFSSIFFW